jgi:Ras-related protein Rab-1A
MLLLNVLTEIVKPLEKPQSKRRISSHEQSSKRSKTSTTTAPIPSGSQFSKYLFIIIYS